MAPKLAILIPTLPERQEKFDLLVNELIRQTIEAGYVYRRDVKVIYDPAPRGKSIGAKRNELLQKAMSDYVAFVDDDDRVEPTYIKNIMEGIEKGVDCCSLRGVYTENGNNPELFEHSIKYDAWVTNHTGQIKYFRPPNHLSCIKTEIAKQFVFPETNFGEDEAWSMAIKASGLIKSEHFIDEIIYRYDFIPNK